LHFLGNDTATVNQEFVNKDWLGKQGDNCHRLRPKDLSVP
jgi:hypothetical protein